MIRYVLSPALPLILIACSGEPTSSVQVEASAQSAAQPATQPAAQAAASAQAQTPAAPEITTQALTGNIYALFGPGGNVGLSVGEDGAFLVDDKFAQNAEGIIAAVRALTDGPIRYVLNTHYHGDHTGGNVAMAETGAVLIAHDNARTNMTRDIESELFGRTLKAAPEEALPHITHTGGMHIHVNGETVKVIFAPGHTDGDSLVHFVDSDVLHMGDVFFYDMYPVIDIDGGGSLQGMIDALATGIEIAGPDTIVIPGHGAITDRAGMSATRDMLIGLGERVQARIDAGDDVDTIVASDILDDLGVTPGFISDEAIKRVAYRSLTR